VNKCWIVYVSAVQCSRGVRNGFVQVGFSVFKMTPVFWFC